MDEDEQHNKDHRCVEKRSMTSTLAVELGKVNWTEDITVKYPLESPRHPTTTEAG